MCFPEKASRRTNCNISTELQRSADLAQTDYLMFLARSECLNLFDGSFINKRTK